MLSCVALVPDRDRIDPLSGQPVTRPIKEDDVEEVSTLLKLRGEVIQIHLGFSPAAVLSSLGTAVRTASSGIPTSQ